MKREASGTREAEDRVIRLKKDKLKRQDEIG
jgi:hypothetical protein